MAKRQFSTTQEKLGIFPAYGWYGISAILLDLAASHLTGLFLVTSVAAVEGSQTCSLHSYSTAFRKASSLQCATAFLMFSYSQDVVYC